jgi:hypothetical protein
MRQQQRLTVFPILFPLNGLEAQRKSEKKRMVAFKSKGWVVVEGDVNKEQHI